MATRAPGTVYLVGAGPGDPGLLTVRGAECIRRADVIVHDRLVNARLLELARSSAKIIDVGKAPGTRGVGQDEINKLLVAKARSGKTVCRLKGGDPFVFGRGGEEALALAEAGVPFEVVPGVTSAVAGPAYAGIPVTHRGLASSVTLVTGTEDAAKEHAAVDWAPLGKGRGTLVFLMGARNLAAIADALVRHGRAPSTPVAIVEWATYPFQVTVETTLDEARDPAFAQSIQPPVVVVVGDVAGLRDRLRWFERKPLFGKRIVVTRPRRQAASLVQQLEELGAEVIELPTIEIKPLKEFGKLDAALRRLGSYDWVVFTSVNGVAACFERLAAIGRDARAFGTARVAAIGEVTAAELVQRGIGPDLVPPTFTSAGLAEAFKRRRIRGKRILLLRADIASDELPNLLRQRGARVTTRTAYRTARARPDATVMQLLVDHPVNVVTFTSASTARAFAAMVGRTQRHRLASKIVYASIGPETTRAADSCGLKIAVEATTHTARGLVEALVGFVERERKTA